MRHLVCILTFFFIACNSNTPVENVPSNIGTVQALTDDTLTAQNNTTIEAKKNCTDGNGLKQGIWDFIEKGQVKGFVTYKNNKLHGLSRHWINYPEQIVEGNYINGIKIGLWKHYYDSKNLMLVKEYKNDTILWIGFPAADKEFHTPVKGFSIYTDSIVIQCPHLNGTTWYKGLFINKKPIGIHYMYYPNGKIRFEHNYSTNTIKIYDLTGKLTEEKQR